MATGSGLGFLAYLLRMVEDDAGAAAKQAGGKATGESPVVRRIKDTG